MRKNKKVETERTKERKREEEKTKKKRIIERS